MTLQSTLYPVFVALAWSLWPSDKGPWLDSRGAKLHSNTCKNVKLHMSAVSLPMPLLAVHSM